MSTWSQTHKKEKKAYDKAYHESHKEERRAYAKIYGRSLKQSTLDHYGNECSCCGETRFEFLSIDHINGGGNLHRKEVGEGTSFYLWLKRNNYPEGFQTLCMNCNFSRGSYGYCPHEKEH
jgi:hypothetical protein